MSGQFLTTRFSPSKIIRAGGHEQLQQLVTDSIADTNAVLHVINPEDRIDVSNVSSQTVVDFVIFLNDHIASALTVSTWIAKMAKAPSTKEQGHIRHQLIDTIHLTPNFFARFPGTSENTIRRLEVLRTDPLFNGCFIKPLEKLDELGTEIERYISEADLNRKASLKNVDQIAAASLDALKNEQAAKKNADRENVKLANVELQLRGLTSTRPDEDDERKTEKLIRLATRVARDESNARIGQAQAYVNRTLSTSALLPGMATSSTITEGEKALLEFYGSLNMAFFFTVSRYEKCIAAVIRAQSQGLNAALKSFLLEIDERDLNSLKLNEKEN